MIFASTPRKWSRCLRLGLSAGLAVSLGLAVGAGLALASAGSLDQSFGNGGKVTTDFTGLRHGAASALVIQPDGKLVAVGTASDNFALARYSPDGSLDQAFGNGGRVLTHFSPGGDEMANAAALQPDGKIVVAGWSNGGQPRPQDYEFRLARYNADGSLDNGFGQDGSMAADFTDGPDWAYAVAVQPDGKIVAAGEWIEPGSGSSFALFRCNSDGSPDLSFGDHGKVMANFSPEDRAYAVGIQPDGRIVVAGLTTDRSDHSTNSALARFAPDGKPDPTFGSNGLVAMDFGGDDYLEGLALLPNGEILVAGYAAVNGSDRVTLARYNPDGSLNSSFGSGGKVTTGIGTGAGADAMALQTDGKIVVAGWDDAGDFALARYNPDGSLDASFSGDGEKTTDFGASEVATAVGIQPDGKIVAAGYSGDGDPGLASTTSSFALARYEAR